MANLRIAPTHEMAGAAAVANLQIAPSQEFSAVAALADLRIERPPELAAMLAAVKVAIAPVQEFATVVANARFNIQQVLAPFQDSVNLAVDTIKLFQDFEANLQRGVEQWMSQQQLSWARMAEMVAAAAASFQHYYNEELANGSIPADIPPPGSPADN